MSFSQESNSSKGKRQVLDMKITKFLPFLCLQTAFEYQQCRMTHLILCIIFTGLWIKKCVEKSETSWSIHLGRLVNEAVVDVLYACSHN